MRQPDHPNALFACAHCGQPAPHEWGADRRCPEYPDKTRPPYMQSCEFEALPIKITCGACLFPSTETAIFGHSHGEGCLFGESA